MVPARIIDSVCQFHIMMVDFSMTPKRLLSPICVSRTDRNDVKTFRKFASWLRVFHTGTHTLAHAPPATTRRLLSRGAQNVLKLSKDTYALLLDDGCGRTQYAQIELDVVKCSAHGVRVQLARSQHDRLAGIAHRARYAFVELLLPPMAIAANGVDHLTIPGQYDERRQNASAT